MTNDPVSGSRSTATVPRHAVATIGASFRTERDLDVQVLFEEARQRRRRRWTIGLVCLVIAVLAALFVDLNLDSPQPRSTPRPGPEASPSVPDLHGPAPSQYVSGDGSGGIGLWSTATGNLIRTLSPQTGGGPDQQATISSDGESVYFAQPSGSCSGTIQTVTLAGGPPATAIAVPGTLALDPSPSPTSSDLAWVAVTCGSAGSSSNLYVTDQTTGVRSDLGPYFGRANDDGVAWNRAGTLLAIEAAPTVKVIEPDDPASPVARLSVPPGCSLSNPAFLPRGNEIAAIRTCDKGTKLAFSEVLVYATSTGRLAGRIAAAPPGATIQSMSVDPSRGHVLMGIVSPTAGAETVRVEAGRYFLVSRRSPTEAEW